MTNNCSQTNIKGAMTFVSVMRPFVLENRKRNLVCMNEGQDGFSDSVEEAEPWALSLNGSNPTGPPKHHVGKWTTEEEVYSLHLIQLFGNGTLLDCKESTTLRAYLSEKLNCKPMRITKKYSAEVYDGKLLYADTDSEDPSPAHLISIRENYLQPKLKRSHKKKVAKDYRSSTSITAPIELLEGTDVESNMGSGATAHGDEDLEGRLTPEDFDLLANISWEL
jgi:hypothetical protein